MPWRRRGRIIEAVGAGDTFVEEGGVGGRGEGGGGGGGG